MKKLFIAAAIIMLAGVSFGQTLQKGSLLGLHNMTITLSPDVSMDQYIGFMTNKMIPEVEKQFKGVSFFFLQGDRGEHENEYASLWYFKTLKDRNTYFTPEGELTEKGAAAQEKLLPLMEEGMKLGTYTTKHTDWVIL